MSIELTITGITEANKREKLIQAACTLAKALAVPLEFNGTMIGQTAVYKPEKLPVQTGRKGSKPYPDIIIDIQGITKANRYEKFIKAVRFTAQQLQLPIGIHTGDTMQHGERHVYPIKQELSEYWENLYTELLRGLYCNLTEVLGLPTFSQEALRKAFIEAEHPRDEAGRFAEKGASNTKYWEKPAATKAEIAQFSEDCLKSKYATEKYLYLGSPSDNAAKNIKDSTGYTIDKITLSSSAVSHALRPKQFEKHKLSENDITRITDIINDQNTIVRISEKEHRGKRPLEFIGNINGKIILVEAVMEKFNELRFVDMYRPYKENIREAGMQAVTPPSTHVRNASLPSSSIPNSSEKASGNLLKKSLASDAIGRIGAVLKNFFGDLKLRYRGSILYNPENGEPLRKKDFDRLIRAVEGVLNANTADVAKHITLDAVTIGKLLQRIATYQPTHYLHALTLDTLAYKGKSYEWIRQEYRNLATALGHPLSKQEQVRYQVCEDSAAQLVQRVNDDIRNGIKETLLDGIQERKSKAQVSQDLFDTFGSLNRSWKRIADTETVNTSNLASILEEVYTAGEGEKVYFKRHEMAGCCKRCEQANGKIALWSRTPLTSEEIEDSFAQVAIWEGKAPDSKRGTLVPGALHPHCRGFWVRWGAEEFNAQAAELNGKSTEWNEAVRKVQAEYQAKGINNPDDSTSGYTKRINAVYRER